LVSVGSDAVHPLVQHLIREYRTYWEGRFPAFPAWKELAAKRQAAKPAR